MTWRDKFSKCFFITVSYAFSGSKNCVQYFYTIMWSHIICFKEMNSIHMRIQSIYRVYTEYIQNIYRIYECNTNRALLYWNENMKWKWQKLWIKENMNELKIRNKLLPETEGME